MKKCKVSGCKRSDNMSYGYCSMHYSRIWRHGTPDKIEKNCTPEYKNYHIMKKLRKEIILSCDGNCQLCGKPGKNLHHLNEDKTDHRKENLIFVCCKCHSRLHGGEKHGPSKLTEKQVIEIRYSKEKQKELAKKYGVSVMTISRAKTKKQWAHI